MSLLPKLCIISTLPYHLQFMVIGVSIGQTPGGIFGDFLAGAFVLLQSLRQLADIIYFYLER